MYIDNVRESINNLNVDQLEEYLTKLRQILINSYDKNVKPSTLKARVYEFVDGKDPQIDSFESYLLAFDELSVNGAVKAIQNKQIKTPTTWRQLLLTVTEDRTFPPDIIKHLDDAETLIEIKALFFNCIEYCKDDGKEQFFTNLHTFNSFLKMKQE